MQDWDGTMPRSLLTSASAPRPISRACLSAKRGAMVETLGKMWCNGAMIRIFSDDNVSRCGETSLERRRGRRQAGRQVTSSHKPLEIGLIDM